MIIGFVQFDFRMKTENRISLVVVKMVWDKKVKNMKFLIDGKPKW